MLADVSTARAGFEMSDFRQNRKTSAGEALHRDLCPIIVLAWVEGRRVRDRGRLDQADGVTLMLLKVSDKIRECLAHAADARERANAATDPSRKADLLDIEQRWLRLVESYRFVEQADRFLEEAHALRQPSVAEIPAQSAVSAAPKGASLAELLEVLVYTAIEQAGGKARAAFYLADEAGAKLHHIIGMTPSYARCVDGFEIGPQSLACGLAACRRQAIITADVSAEPRWQPWLWLAQEFGYRACWSFPVETPEGKIVGTFAMYFNEPTEATPRDLDLASALTRAAGTIISRH